MSRLPAPYPMRSIDIAELLADGENEGTLDAWLSDRTLRVLDLCTGNGSLAVLAALADAAVHVRAQPLERSFAECRNGHCRQAALLQRALCFGFVAGDHAA